CAEDTVSVPDQLSSICAVTPEYEATTVLSEPKRATSTPSRRIEYREGVGGSSTASATSEGENSDDMLCSGNSASTFEMQRGSFSPQSSFRSATQSRETRTSFSRRGTGSPVKFGVEDAGMEILCLR